MYHGSTSRDRLPRAPALEARALGAHRAAFPPLDPCTHDEQHDRRAEDDRRDRVPAREPARTQPHPEHHERNREHGTHQDGEQAHHTSAPQARPRRGVEGGVFAASRDQVAAVSAAIGERLEHGRPSESEANRGGRLPAQADEPPHPDHEERHTADAGEPE
ncbi:MAG TPA: hypothetical protein VJ992_11950 [Gemmatimonadales bacterium]|nr:hypothetical protein [Gemmatimonadales bacterium]